MDEKNKETLACTGQYLATVIKRHTILHDRYPPSSPKKKLNLGSQKYLFNTSSDNKFFRLFAQVVMKSGIFWLIDFRNLKASD